MKMCQASDSFPIKGLMVAVIIVTFVEVEKLARSSSRPFSGAGKLPANKSCSFSL